MVSTIPTVTVTFLTPLYPMLELLATLLPISLIDSLSIIPVALVPIVVLLAGRKPVIGTVAFIGGIFLTYFPFGLLLLFGLDDIFESLANAFSAWWNSDPDFGEVILEIVVGFLMCVSAFKLMRKGQQTKQSPKGRSDMSPAQAFSLGAIINLSGMWGALPYFAAVAQILKEDLSTSGMVSSLLFYNLVFISPLFSLLVLHLILGARAEKWFTSFSKFIIDWGKRALIAGLMLLGITMIADGLGWLNGTPLLVQSGWEGPKG